MTSRIWTLALLAVAACQQPAADTNLDNKVTAPAGSNSVFETTPSFEAGSARAESNSARALNEADDAGSTLPPPPNTPESAMIPDQYRGRWGMVAADCDRTRSDAKGAITIGERNLIFYESRAVLTKRRPAIATSFSGLFAFTGEGQAWSKVMTFTRTGDTLTRADADGRFTYERC